MAEKLVITTNTVKRHLNAIFEKLTFHTRSVATAKVAEGYQNWNTRRPTRCATCTRFAKQIVPAHTCPGGRRKGVSGTMSTS